MADTIDNISVDCVIFGFDSKYLNVVLVERELRAENGQVFIKDHTLPGYHILRDEDLADAAARILKDLTGLENVHLEQFYVFGDPARLMNPKDQLWITNLNMPVDNRTITVAFYSLIDNTKVELSKTERNAKWFRVHELPELAFDHGAIIEKALEQLKVEVVNKPIVFELLPQKFTLTQLQTLYEAVLDIHLDRRNFRKKLAQMSYIVPLNEKQKGVAHKPAQLFTFSKKVYEITKKDRYVISF